MQNITIDELSVETAQLLPTRETLNWFSTNFANVVASNSSLALNAGSLFAVSQSAATQNIGVYQH